MWGQQVTYVCTHSLPSVVCTSGRLSWHHCGAWCECGAKERGECHRALQRLTHHLLPGLSRHGLERRRRQFMSSQTWVTRHSSYISTFLSHCIYTLWTFKVLNMVYFQLIKKNLWIKRRVSKNCDLVSRYRPAVLGFYSNFGLRTAILWVELIRCSLLLKYGDEDQLSWGGVLHS